jgi:hypothetical protein
LSLPGARGARGSPLIPFTNRRDPWFTELLPFRSERSARTACSRCMRFANIAPRKPNAWLPLLSRSGLCLVIAVSLIATGTAAAASAPAFSLVVQPPRTFLVKHPDLIIHCPTAAEIEACTELLGLRLDCRCRRGASGWRLEGTAQMIPYVYLSNRRWAGHEAAHLDDLRSQIEAFFGELSSRSFDSEDDCLAVGDFESAVFILRMDIFRRRSNERLH